MASLDAASADAIVATAADDAASSADAIAATLTAAKTGDLRPSPPRAIKTCAPSRLRLERAALGRRPRPPGFGKAPRRGPGDGRLISGAPAAAPLTRRRRAAGPRSTTRRATATLMLLSTSYNGPTSTRTRAPEGGVSPQQFACWRNEFDVVKRLVAAGVDVSQKNDAGCGFAHWLACAPRDAGDLRPLAAWLAARLGPAALAVEPNGHGHTCLHKAAFAGHFDLCAYLVSAFAASFSLFALFASRRVASTAC